MMERYAASKVSEMLLAELGMKASQLNDLKTLPLEKLMAARYAVQARLPTGYFADLISFAPVLDPDLLPRHPFHPDATSLSADVPLLIGSSQTEMIFFMGNDAAGFNLDEAGLHKRVESFLGPAADEAIMTYRQRRPSGSPSDLYIQIWSDFSVTNGIQKQAERKAAQNSASVYLYQFNWRSPVLDGKFKSMHTMVNPFIWNDIEGSRALTGGGDEAKALAKQMSDAWVAFAATGNPNAAKSGLPDWPAFNTIKRATMLFDNHSIVMNDPYKSEREILN
jgi:para-nitrobenzyl esterase